MRFSVIIPLVFAIGAFVLSFLCLFAGSKPSFMTDFDIVTLNTTTLGFAVDEDATPTSSGAQPSPTSIGSYLSGLAENATDAVGDFFDDVQDGVASTVADALGIHEFYSFHLMNMCMGYYSPNGTAEGAHKNVTGCTHRTAMYHFDPTALLQQELDQGPLAGRIDLTDLGYPEDMQTAIDGLNTAMSAMFVLYCIGIAATGLAIITGLLAFFLTGRLWSFLNWMIAIIAFLALGIASAIVTAIMVKAVNIINDKGNDAGLYASKGTKFLILTWVATAAMFVASIWWVGECCVGRRKKHVTHTEKRHVDYTGH